MSHTLKNDFILPQKIAIIGLGLIGGSMALRLKQLLPQVYFYGVDHLPQHQQQALNLQLVHEIISLQQVVHKAELIIIAVPVNESMPILQYLLPLIGTQVVMDTGSTKNNICNLVHSLPGKNRFVATHPMWGTEHSGPKAATANSFKGNAAVICNPSQTDKDALQMVAFIYQLLEMHLIYMDAQAHDVHAAYISHISHISSFALANTVLQKEKEDRHIFEMASAGFESTVRLAKSNSAMWVPIFIQNKTALLDVLKEHIHQLNTFKKSLENENELELANFITSANNIKRILK